MMGKVIMSGIVPQLKLKGTGVVLSDIAEGSVVKLNENGTPVEFYVACHNYESGNNGLGRTLLVRKDVKEDVAFGSTAASTIAYGSTSCILSSWMNTYVTQLDASVQSAMGTTTIQVATGFNISGTVTLGTISVPAFQLSAAEISTTPNDSGGVEGSALPIVDLLKIAKMNGTATKQWTRTKYYNFGASNVYYITEAGKLITARNETATYGARPAFTLPSTAVFDEETLLFKEVS